MNEQPGWLPLFEEEPSTAAAVYWTGSPVDKKDGVMTRQIEKQGKRLPLIVIAVFDTPAPKLGDRPGEVVWCPLTEKSKRFVFQFRVADAWEGDKKKCIFFLRDCAEIAGFFRSDIRGHWRQIYSLRRTRLDSEFHKLVRGYLEFPVKDAR